MFSSKRRLSLISYTKDNQVDSFRLPSNSGIKMGPSVEGFVKGRLYQCGIDVHV